MRSLSLQADYRFMSKVTVQLNGCWLWNASRLPNGYGRYNYGGRTGYAHRFAFERTNGPVPDGHEVCHTCDVRHCVNPAHLYAGTRRDNVRDMVRRGRGHWQRDPERAREMGRCVGATQRGEQHSNAKLSSKDVEVVRYLLNRGCFVPDIAQVFGVSKSTISDIEHGRKRRGD